MLSRRSFLCAVTAAQAGQLVGLQADRAAQEYPFGAIHMSTIPHWQHYLPPIEKWAAYIERDIQRMKAVNFNTVVVHVDWYDIQPAPDRFEFARHDRLLDIVDRLGMRVLLWPWPELQPEWVLKQQPDSEWIASDGYRPGSACWDHPVVRNRIEQFVERVVSRYRDRASVIGWDLGAEAGIWVSGVSNPVNESPRARLYCYCASTVQRYREWLRQKYGSIGQLNEVWATYYDDWSQVEPVRTGVFERAQIFWLDWREFMLWNTADFQALKMRAARDAGAKPPITAHIGGWGAGYAYHAADEFHIARSTDILGLSFFPFWLQRSEPYKPAYGAMMLDGIRSAADGKPIWVEELQGGPSIFGLEYRSPTPRPEDIRLWTWQSVAHGANGIFYWNWRPETTGIEASGFGLVNYDGTLTDRVRAAGEVSAVLQKYADFFIRARPAPAQIAIFHSPRTSLLATGEGGEALYRRSLRGLYTALWEGGYPVDFLVSDQLARDLGRYRIIYLPFAYTLSPDEGKRLREYVHQGGRVYAELWCGLKDDRTFLYETVPGAGMAEVLGCTEIASDPAGNDTVRVIRGHPSVRVTEGSNLPVSTYRETMRVHPGAAVIAEFDDRKPALISNNFGKGSSLYAATMLCHSYDVTPQRGVRELITGLAESAGCKPPVRVDNADIETRLLMDSVQRRVAVFLNHGPNSVDVEATIDGVTGGFLTDVLRGERVPVGSGAPAKVKLELPPFSVKVLMVRGT